MVNLTNKEKSKIYSLSVNVSDEIADILKNFLSIVQQNSFPSEVAEFHMNKASQEMYTSTYKKLKLFYLETKNNE